MTVNPFDLPSMTHGESQISGTTIIAQIFMSLKYPFLTLNFSKNNGASCKMKMSVEYKYIWQHRINQFAILIDACLIFIVLILYLPVNNYSVMSG